MEGHANASLDVEHVLKLEASNETAKEEQTELQELMRRRDTEREAKQRVSAPYTLVDSVAASSR